MSLTFYHVPSSTSTVTLAVLSELSHSLAQPLAHRINLSIQSGDTKTAHYLSTVNPNGRVPAIVHDGVSIWESAAITMYLGETFGVHEGDAELYPAPGPPRGEAMKWIVWANTTLAAAGGRLAASLPVGAPGGVEAGSRDVVTSVGKEDLRREEEKARIEVEEALKILEVGLMGKDFLLGKSEHGIVLQHKKLDGESWR
ncbi:MAG: hypothetical protein Q9190_007659 [Brigantiaea leucoxantha]